MAKKKGAGRFGSKYGKKVRDAVITVSKLQNSKKKCPKCGKLAFKRYAAGIWICKSCGAKMIGGAYQVDTGSEKLLARLHREA